MQLNSLLRMKSKVLRRVFIISSFNVKQKLKDMHGIYSKYYQKYVRQHLVCKQINGSSERNKLLIHGGKNDTLFFV